MNGMIIRNSDRNISYNGTRFDGLEDKGTKHLLLRTGNNPDEVKKYGLTSKPLDDRYKSIKMKLNINGSNNTYYVAQNYRVTNSSTYTNSYTTTRYSSYTSTVQNVDCITTSSTSMSTNLLTRSSSYISSSIKTLGSSTYTSTTNLISRSTVTVNNSYTTKVSSSSLFSENYTGTVNMTSKPIYVATLYGSKSIFSKYNHNLTAMGVAGQFNTTPITYTAYCLITRSNAISQSSVTKSYTNITQFLKSSSFYNSLESFRFTVSFSYETSTLPCKVSETTYGEIYNVTNSKYTMTYSTITSRFTNSSIVTGLMNTTINNISRTVNKTRYTTTSRFYTNTTSTLITKKSSSISSNILTKTSSTMRSDNFTTATYWGSKIFTSSVSNNYSFVSVVNTWASITTSTTYIVGMQLIETLTSKSHFFPAISKQSSGSYSLIYNYTYPRYGSIPTSLYVEEFYRDNKIYRYQYGILTSRSSSSYKNTTWTGTYTEIETKSVNYTNSKTITAPKKSSLYTSLKTRVSNYTSYRTISLNSSSRLITKVMESLSRYTVTETLTSTYISSSNNVNI